MVSEIIDSSNNIELSHIEDMFVLSEIDNLDCTNIEPSLQRNINEIRRQIVERVKNYEFYKKFLSKKNEVRFKDADWVK